MADLQRMLNQMYVFCDLVKGSIPHLKAKGSVQTYCNDCHQGIWVAMSTYEIKKDKILLCIKCLSARLEKSKEKIELQDFTLSQIREIKQIIGLEVITCPKCKNIYKNLMEELEKKCRKCQKESNQS